MHVNWSLTSSWFKKNKWKNLTVKLHVWQKLQIALSPFSHIFLPKRGFLRKEIMSASSKAYCVYQW